MERKTIGILLIILVMIISIGAISAADANETLQGEVSDTMIATTSIAFDESNATSLGSESGGDVEKISVNNNEISNQKVGDNSNVNEEVLYASNDDLLKASSGSFYYNNHWYDDLDDAVDEACDNNGGTIRIWRGTYGSDSDDVKITISDGVDLTLEPYDSTHTVIFDGSKNDKWFFSVDDKNAHVTINSITFRNGGAFQGGAIEVDEGQLTLNNCIFEGNKAFQNLAGGYGWGGAIYVDDDQCSLIARNCRFINNNAARGGGAVCVEGDGSSATFENCYFEGNKQGDEENDVYDKDSGTHSFSYCDFIGHGSIEFTVNYAEQSVEITPEVDDEVNYLVLYHYGELYETTDCNSGSTKTFENLQVGSYTIYMMYNTEKRFIYKQNSFRIVANDFVLNDDQAFQSLSAAVNAIPDGGTGVITVKSGFYTESENFNVEIKNNKNVTIMSRDNSLEPVIFSTNSYLYQQMLKIDADCHLTMEDITITGLFNNALYFASGSYGTISNCEFENIGNDAKTMHPIYMWNSNVVLNDCTFESNGNILCSYSALNINDCTFTNNSAGYDGGAIGAGTSNLTINGSKFIDNVASRYGGAIYAAHLKIYDTEFTGNSAERGGAVYITNANSIINITECVFDSNTANNYRNIYSDSTTREINLEYNEYDLNLTIIAKDGSYGLEYDMDGVFDWGSNLNNNYTVLAGVLDNETIFGDLKTIEDNEFKINMGVLSGGTHEFSMIGMYTQSNRLDYFYGHDYYSDLYGNEFYLNDVAYAKILIEKAKITLNLAVENVLIPETPVLNVNANFDLNYTIFIGNKYYQLEVVNGKGSMQLTGLDLGNYTVVAMRDGDENYYLVMNFTTFSVSKTYSNFLVLSTNVEYDTLNDAVANSNNIDIIYIKNGTYKNTGVVISNKTLDIIALEGAIFDAQGSDANFIIVNENAVVDIYGITFTGLHNRNTNYGAIVNHGHLSIDSCNFTNNKITKTSFAKNGGAAIFSDGYSLEIDNCNFINNAAPLKVGTAAVTSLGFEDVSIIDSKFINNTAREGGALHFKNISQFEAAIISCDFEQNTAVKGSAIYVGNNSRYIAVTLSDFKKNNIKNSLGENAQLEGGVIYVNANTTEVVLDIDLSNFENNSNSNVDGGVICLDGVSKAYIESSIFTNNSGKMGSVILIKNPYTKKLTLFVDSSNFINNNATTGAIVTSPKVTTFIDDCLFANNTGQNRHIYSNGFTVVHDSIFEVKDANLNALSVLYGENSLISGTADIGTNIYATANLTVARENIGVEIKNNTFTYNAGILGHGKYYAVLNSITDMNNNTYLMDSITKIFRVNRNNIELNVSVDNITYGETLTIVERLPSIAKGTIEYQLNGKYYTKEEIEALKLDARKYTLVAIYDYDDFAFSSSIVNFEVYKANPTISVPDVEVEYNNSIILNIETNVPSIYTIEIEDYKTITFINGSKSIEIKKIFNPGNYTIKVTSNQRQNYISNSTEAILKVNENLPSSLLSVSSTDTDILGIAIEEENDLLPDTSNNIPEQLLLTSLSIMQSTIDDTNNLKSNLKNEDILLSSDNGIIGSEYDEYKFIYQYDEDDDYEYFETLEDAIDEAVLYGAGIITVRGGTYSGYGFCGIEIEGEVELTIKAFEGEEVIFDCENQNYFLYLTYETEMEPTTTPPFFETYQTEGPTVTLDNITVINGYNSDGGVIEMDAGTLTLANCTFSNNTADYGGVIYIGSSTADEDAMVIALNTTFTNNYASAEGGAIYIASGMQDTSASFYFCTFLDNYQGEDERTMNYFAGDGVDEITRKYCIFNGNGTIHFEIDKINQTVTVNGTSTDSFDSIVLLYFNQVPLYSIYNNGSKSFNITFEDVMGGNYTIGVMNDHDFNTYIFDVKVVMKVPNFIISEDEVYENLTEAIDAVAENGIIYANVNYYDEDNMEIDIRKSFTLKNFREDGVIFDGSSSKWFFTIAEGCTVVFDGISFTDGAIKNQAAIENNGTLIITNCSFEGFETVAIIYNSGLLNILNSTFSLNFIGNAIVLNDKDLVINTVEFSSNIINISSVVYNNGDAEIISSNFTDNYNSGNGGTIYNAKSLLVNCTVFSENEGYNGGAVYNEGTLTVLNSTFEDNTANGYGGAIYNGNKANIFNSTFTGSSSEKDGGAIYNNNITVVDNSTFVGNTATGKGGAIYNYKSLEVTKSIFGINFAEECANIYNAGDIQFSQNIFDFYDVILVIPDGQYGIPTTITATLNPEFNMDLQVTLPRFVNGKDATVTISEGVFEYTTDILPKGIYDVKLDEIIYDGYDNIYYGQSVSDRLIIHKANVYINLTVEDIVLKGTSQDVPVLKISASKNGTFQLLFNNKFTTFNITGSQTTIRLDTVGEGNYSVIVVREGDENYNDAINTTSFTVSEYEGNFIVNSTGSKFETLYEAILESSSNDIIYINEGTYFGNLNLGWTISNKKLTIIALGDVVFDANSTYSEFLTIANNADVTICNVVFTGFNPRDVYNKGFKDAIIYNKGNLTVDGCVFVNNNLQRNVDQYIIYSVGNLSIVKSGFYDNKLYYGLIIYFDNQLSNLVINESTFDNNTLDYRNLIFINYANSVKIISNVFSENKISRHNIIDVERSSDVFISSEFYNNTLANNIIYSNSNNNMIVNDSIFTGNKASRIIFSQNKNQNTISGCLFGDNTVENVVNSKDKNLSVLESVFSGNTLSKNGALYIESGVNAIINSSVFTDNNANNYRNIYSTSDNLIITNSVFDALNVNYTVYDIDYGQSETIEGSIDVGTNLKFSVNLDINDDTYLLNITDNKFTYNSGILNAGDYIVVLNPQDNNSNTFVFDKITKVFTVSRIDPGLSVSIEDIAQGEKLNVTLTIAKKAKGNVVYELNGNVYSKDQLENLTLNTGNYLIKAVYRGDKNYIPASELVNVKVNKVAPNITVNDVAVNYGNEIKINVTSDVADYYTVFLDNKYNESISLYVVNSTIFTFSSENFKPGSYEITVYVFESDDYAEAYAHATLTVNRAKGFFNLSNDLIIEGENATVDVKVPVNAYGNITYRVYDVDVELVYNITQSCLKELIIPNLGGGRYIVTGTYEGDLYYNNNSIINSCVIFVRKSIDINISVSNITYGENATVVVKSNVDGEYLVYVGNKSLLVTVINGIGNESVSNLSAGNYTVNVTVVNGNYSGFNETVFEVAPKSALVAVYVEDIVFGENAIVIVNGEIDGEYIVVIYGENYTVNVADGKGNTTVDSLAIGENILVTVKIADGNYNASNTTTFNVFSKYNTPIELDIVTGENNVAMTVTVSDAATGIVKFQVTGAEEYVVYSDVINGVAILEDVLETGDYTVTVTYMGNDRFNTNITYKDFTIKGHIKKNTTINAHADVNGNRVTLTVNVDKNATGFVKLTVGGTVANIEVEDGVATLTTVLVPNSYLVDVTYLGGDDFNMNSTHVTFTITEVSKENTTIDLNIVVYEDTALIKVDLNKTVTGLVKFYMVSKETGENYTMYMDVKDGHVETFTNSIEPGNYTVTVTYMGDSVFNTNTTSKDVEIIGHVMKDTPINVDVETSANRVTLNVKVDKNATGFVEVKSGDSVSNIALKNGEGTLTITLPYGSYSLDITYLGDENYNKNSTKAEFTLVVPEKENTPISLDIVTDENYVGMTVTVSDAATGIVKFQVSGEEEYVVYSDVINGKAILEDVLVVGDYNVIATYMGDNRFNTNITYGDFTIGGHIKKNTTINARADVVGNRVTLTVNVDENATGFVKLTVGDTVTNIEVEDGVATLTTVLVPNSYFVDVTYLGDDDFNMNTTKVTFTITEVSKKNTNIDLNITVDEDTALIEVDLNKDVTGLVKFYMVSKETGENSTMYMDVKDGHVETFTNSIEPGNYTVTVTYMGDSVFNTNTTSKDVEIIGHVMKDTPITASVVVNGNRVTLTVNVDENATGFVELKFGDNLFNLALKDGIGTLTTSLPYGSYNLDITYLGDENYNKNSTKCEFTLIEPEKENTPISLDIVTDENNVTMTVTVSDAASGIVKFQVSGEEEYVVYSDVINGKAILEDILVVGNYNVIATYMGDNSFNTNITSKDFTINAHIKKNTTINARADVNRYKVTITVTVDENATGFVRLTIGETVANIELVDGIATVTATFAANSYFADVTYLGDDNFNGNNTKLTFTVTDSGEKPDAEIDVENNATGMPVLVFKLPAEAGGNLSIYVNGILSKFVNLVNGSAIINLPDLSIGDNNVSVVYSGDGEYKAVNKSLIINRKATIIAFDTTRGYNSGLDYTATLFDNNGSPLANTNVTVKVNTNTYTVQTDSNGELKFNNELGAGNYAIAIVNPETGEYKLTNLNIVGRITENNDLAIFFADGSDYKFRVIGDDGNYVGAGEVVTITVGGVTYSVVTDVNGYANIKLILGVGIHDIAVTYKGFTANNVITVKSVVKPVKNLVTVKKTASKLKIKVKLAGQKVLVRKLVYLKFNGKTYKAKTNNKGVATFNVPKKVIKKLKKGKKYKALFTYNARSNGVAIKDLASCYVKVK